MHGLITRFGVILFTNRREWGEKCERQYEHVKESEEERGQPEKSAKRIAAATVNKTRSEIGETKEAKKM